MPTNSDFRELLSVLNDYDARYLVIGDYAVMLYTEPRFTKHLDLWVEPTIEDGSRVFEALGHFGALLAGVTPEDFSSEGFFYQMGSPPVRVDILTSVTGMRFEEAWPRRVERDLEGVRTPFISREDLIRIKSALGRRQDLMDVDALKKVPGSSA
ncbi:MAG: nucleotidyltransferase [Acidobacteria bacterium]|nr:nucleotidyltransferase [Acidobacteriota bacterium]